MLTKPPVPYDLYVKHYLLLSADLIVKTPCGSRLKLDLVIDTDGSTEVSSLKLKYLGGSQVA